MALLPESARELVETFHRRFKLGRVGTLMSDIYAMDATDRARERFSPQDIDQETRNLLGEWMRRQPNYSKLSTPTQANYLKKHEHRGAELQPERTAFGDSLVIIGDHVTWRAAQIETLLDIRLYPSRVGTYHTVTKVRYFAELSEKDALHDPYRRSRDTGRIFYAEGEKADKEVVSIDQILCHFAMTPDVRSDAISRGHIHALPLIRVRYRGFFACSAAHENFQRSNKRMLEGCIRETAYPFSRLVGHKARKARRA